MKKIISIITLSLIMLTSLPVFGASLPAEEAANLLSALNIMVGDDNGDMHFDNLVSRAEFTKISVASSNYRNSVATNLRTSSYKDVPAFHWAAPYIKVGVDNGLCKGYYDSTFRPDNTVTYEEAITMLLRVLGYTDDDFGNSWPYGQIGMADSLGISDGVDGYIGEEITRRKAATLVYNTLNTKMKDSEAKLLSIFDAQKIEDTVLISTTSKSSTSKNEVYTSNGTFKYDSQIDASDMGKDGDLYIKNGDTLLAFVPYEKSLSSEKHIVYSMLSDSVITYKNGKMDSLTIPSNTLLYEDNMQTTYSAKSPLIEMGDVLYVQKDDKGNLDYVIYEKGNVDGPYTVTSSAAVLEYSSAKILRNGEEASISEIQSNDIIYYISDLNMLMVYSNKITGIYENAEPNKDAPTSITVSGISYKVESSQAFEKLSSSGSYKYGDTVTLLLGKTNDVADVVSLSNTTEEVYGYLYETGKKEYTKSDLSKYTNFYISVVTPDGKTSQYIADKDYEDYKNSVKRITFKDGIASAGTVQSSFDSPGTFDWTNKKIGTASLASDVNIIDISTVDPNKTGKYVTVFPSRIDGVRLTSDNVLYAERNSKNQISSLILKDVTGDAYDYGLVVKAENKSSAMSVSGSYTIDIGGITSSLSTSGTAYGIESGDVAKLGLGTSGQLQSAESVEAIDKITDKITNMSATSLTAGGNKYPISDKAVVYKKSATGLNYTVIPIADIITDNDYSITAYYDKKPEYGGQIRIIVVREK